jgi:hypothetical protein
VDQSSRFPIAPASCGVDSSKIHQVGDPLVQDHSAENLATVRTWQVGVFSTSGVLSDAVAHLQSQISIFVAAMAGVLLTQEQQAMLDAVAKASVNVGARMDEAVAAVAALRTATAEPEL